MTQKKNLMKTGEEKADQELGPKDLTQPLPSAKEVVSGKRFDVDKALMKLKRRIKNT